MTENTQDTGGWHLSKVVQIPIIITLLLQIAGGIVSLTLLRADVSHNSEKIQNLQADVKELEVSVHGIDVQLSSIETSIDDMKDILEKIDARVP